MKTDYTTAIALICRTLGIPDPEAEYRFFPPRRWRVDFYWHAAKVALEVEGGVYTRGRHVRGEGFVKDLLKYNALAALNIRLVRCTPKMLQSGEAALALEAVFHPQKESKS